MKTNMGLADRLLRIIVALSIAALYFLKLLTGTAGVILLVIAGIFLVTSFVGFCPLYRVFGASTRRKTTV